MPEMTGSIPNSIEGNGVRRPIFCAASWSMDAPPTLSCFPVVRCTSRPVRKLAVFA